MRNLRKYEIKTQDDLDKWVRENIIEFMSDENLQLEVSRKRNEIVEQTGKI